VALKKTSTPLTNDSPLLFYVKILKESQREASPPLQNSSPFPLIKGRGIGFNNFKF
jgi:hypothetical protein